MNTIQGIDEGDPEAVVHWRTRVIANGRANHQGLGGTLAMDVRKEVLRSRVF